MAVGKDVLRRYHRTLFTAPESALALAGPLFSKLLYGL